MKSLKLAIEKLLSLNKIVTRHGCWVIANLPESNGYTRISIGKDRFSVHRLSAIHFLGLDPNSSSLALHKNECHNRECWNPEHLYIGTYADNLSDTTKLGMGMHVGRKKPTKCPKGHDYLIFGFKNGKGAIECRQCNRDRHKKRYYDNLEAERKRSRNKMNIKYGRPLEK